MQNIRRTTSIPASNAACFLNRAAVPYRAGLKRRTALIFVAALALILVSAAVFAAVSCKAKPSGGAFLPPETPLFSQRSIGYGVVNISFAHVLATPEAVSAGSAGIIRRGSIVEIIERRPVPTAANSAGAAPLWLYITALSTGNDDAGSGPVSGWVSGTNVDFYENLPKAKTASALMLR